MDITNGVLIGAAAGTLDEGTNWPLISLLIASLAIVAGAVIASIAMALKGAYRGKHR